MHGGAFIGGDKTDAYNIPARQDQINLFLAQDIAFVNLNYRLLQANDQEGVLKPMSDAARALQFLRYYHESFNVDSSRVGFYGNSAGAGTAMWLAFHPDMAEPGASDPILRESTRIIAAAGFEGQATYDLLKWESVVFNSIGLDINAVATDLGLTQRFLAFNGANNSDEVTSAEGQAYRSSVDMLGLMSVDDPEFWIANTEEEADFPNSEKQLVHHPLHAKALEDRANVVGISSIVYAPKLDILDPSSEQITQFLIRKISQ